MSGQAEQSADAGLYETQSRVVTGETAEHLPALNFQARLAQDAPDIATLERMLGLCAPEEGAAIHRRQPPHSNRKTRLIMKGGLGKRASPAGP